MAKQYVFGGKGGVTTVSQNKPSFSFSGRPDVDAKKNQLDDDTPNTDISSLTKAQLLEKIVEKYATLGRILSEDETKAIKKLNKADTIAFLQDEDNFTQEPDNAPQDEDDAPQDPEGDLRVLTQEDLDNNPELVEQGLSVGDEVILPTTEQ